MSLKVFHIVFITASILLTLGFGGWSLVTYFTAGGSTNLMMALGSILVMVALILYERTFLRKYQKMG